MAMSIESLTQVGGAMQIRQPSTALLTVSSSDRYPSAAASRGVLDPSGAFITIPSTPYKFTIRKAQSIMNGFFTRIGVTEVRMPWIIPNVNFSTNKILLLTAGAPIPISLTLGFYTPVGLAAALQAAIRAIPGGAWAGFTVTYGEYTPKPRFRFDSEGLTPDFSFAPMPPNYTSGDPGYYPFNESRRQLYDLLGLTYLITANPNDAAILPSMTGGDTLCQYTDFVDIVCSNLTLNQSLKDDSTSLRSFDSLCRLYITASPQNFPYDASGAPVYFAPPGTTPQVIYKDFSSPKFIQWNAAQPIGQLTFEVYDDQGYSLDSAINFSGNTYDINVGRIALTGAEWDMTLQVTEN